MALRGQQLIAAELTAEPPATAVLIASGVPLVPPVAGRAERPSQMGTSEAGAERALTDGRPAGAKQIQPCVPA